MSKVKLDYGPIQNNCINALDSVISYLNTTISYLEQNSIPGDFYYYNTLSNTISNLRTQRDRLSAVKSWLVDSNANYDGLIDRLNNQAAKLPVYDVKKRTTII